MSGIDGIFILYNNVKYCATELKVPDIGSQSKCIMGYTFYDAIKQNELCIGLTQIWNLDLKPPSKLDLRVPFK